VNRVCVVGAGTIGSLFAGHLAQVADVAVLCRRADHARALHRGLRVSGKSQLHARVRASDDPAALPAADLVIVASKATQLERVAQSMEGHFPDAVVMTVQNGIGAEEIVRRHGRWPIVSAVTFMSGVRHSDAHVEYELDTATWMGPYAGTQTPFETVEEIRALIVASGLKAEAFEDLLPAQWSKLIFNSAVNCVAALTGLPHVGAYAEVEESRDLGHVVRAVVEEGRAVAAAAGIELHEDPWEMNVRAVRRGATAAAAGAYAHVPSMLEDVLHHRQTEVDFIAGALVGEAARHHVPVPVTAALWRLVRGREASWNLGVRLPEAVSA
jgi:2-dehydropantoate 2-reductase